MISILSNTKEFKENNLIAWENSWKYWYKKKYIHSGVKEYLKKEIYNIQKAKGKKLIVSDIGCGSGWLYEEIKNITKKYIGIDFNYELVKQLKKDYIDFKNCSFIKFNLEKNFKTNQKCDLAIISLSIVEITNLDHFFINLKNILKKNSTVIIVGLNPVFEVIRVSNNKNELKKNLKMMRSSDSVVYLVKEMNFNSRKTSHLYYRILYSAKDIIKASSKAGFSLIQFDDKINFYSEITYSPIYFSINLKKC